MRTPRLITREERGARNASFRPGTRLKRVIHAGLDLVPMPANIRNRIKVCSGCAKREKWLNQLPHKLRRFKASIAALVSR